MARVPESYWQEYNKKKTDIFPKIMIGFIVCTVVAGFILALCMR